jgi:hypothetical protein
MEMLSVNGAKFFATDYESFESLFTEELMGACEFQLYDFMTGDLPEFKLFSSYVHDMLGGENQCDFYAFRLFLTARRMSGEMCTSLGNSFSNLMFQLFVAEECKCRCECVIEGDDGLGYIYVLAGGRLPTAKDYERLGLRIKLEYHDELTTASFCGLIFDPEELINVAEPLEKICRLGWTSRRYTHAREKRLKSLLRSKALSMWYEYRGCPLLSALATRILYLTKSYSVESIINSKNTTTYERNRLTMALSQFNLATSYEEASPGPRTRLLFEKQFDISVSLQIQIESYMRNLTSVEPIDLGRFAIKMPIDWEDYAKSYLYSIPPHRCNDPPLCWNTSMRYREAFDEVDPEWIPYIHPRTTSCR